MKERRVPNSRLEQRVLELRLQAGSSAPSYVQKLVVVVCFIKSPHHPRHTAMTTNAKRKSAIVELKALLQGDEDRLRVLLKELLQELLEQEMIKALAAAPSERTPDRAGYRGPLPAQPGRPRRQTGIAGSPRPGRPILNQTLRAPPAFRASPGGRPGRGVYPGCVDAQGEIDHRGTVRSQHLRFHRFPNQQAPR